MKIIRVLVMEGEKKDLDVQTEARMIRGDEDRIGVHRVKIVETFYGSVEDFVGATKFSLIGERQ